MSLCFAFLNVCDPLCLLKRHSERPANRPCATWSAYVNVFTSKTAPARHKRRGQPQSACIAHHYIHSFRQAIDQETPGPTTKGYKQYRALLESLASPRAVTTTSATAQKHSKATLSDICTRRQTTLHNQIAPRACAQPCQNFCLLCNPHGSLTLLHNQI